MALYSRETGFAAGLNQLINEALLHIADPQEPILARLLDGTYKVLSIEWKGPFTDQALCDEEPDEWGNWRVGLHTCNADPLYLCPPTVNTATLNIRMGVPLWVYGWRENERVAIAAGLFHPLFTSTTLDVWNTDDGQHAERLYVADPRDSDSEEPLQLRRQWQMARLESSGGHLPMPKPFKRPSLSVE